ncbi:MAG: 16S rRNA (guanine(527)-N(7))-methyltransferase RsmG [Ignavibacteria bacterium]
MISREMTSSESASPLKFYSILKKNGIFISYEQLQKLEAYVRLILEWNSKVNLISRSDTRDIWFAHLLHSLSPMLLFEFPLGLRVLDLGTGGGLPGIPLAILNPECTFSLLDSTRKKIIALQDIVSKLDLTNVTLINARAEELSNQPVAPKFDLVVARAVASLFELAKWSRPLLKPATRQDARSHRTVSHPALLAYKGGDLTREIDELKKKIPECIIEVKNVVFKDSNEIGLDEKKIVFVCFN